MKKRPKLKDGVALMSMVHPPGAIEEIADAIRDGRLTTTPKRPPMRRRPTARHRDIAEHFMGLPLGKYQMTIEAVDNDVFRSENRIELAIEDRRFVLTPELPIVASLAARTKT